MNSIRILLNDNKTLAFIEKFYVWTIATKKNLID